ncbi:MAG: hypothetical protein AB8F74_13920 [Saprospiraceae bacterium]
MTRRLFFLVVPLCFLLFSTTVSNAQKGVKGLDETFTWSEASETKTILIDIKEGARKLKMNFEGEIKTGDLVVTAYDPDGNKAAHLSLICSKGKNTYIHIDIPDEGGTGSNSSSNSDSNSSTTSEGTSVTVTTTTTTEDGDKKRKHKHKNKVKNKKSKSNTRVSTDSNSEGSKGIMHKNIVNPDAGTWKLIIKTERVSGELEASVKQS